MPKSPLIKYIIAFSLVAIIIAVVVWGSSKSSLTGYAPIMTNYSNRDGLAQQYSYKANYPDHGIVIVSAVFFSRQATWTVVDLDAKTISSIGTNIQQSASGEEKAVASSDTTRPLTDEEMSEIVLRANEEWNPPPSSDANPSSGSCNVILLNNEHMKKVGCNNNKLVDFIRTISPAK